MKNYLLLFLLVGCLFIESCHTAKVPYAAMVTPVADENPTSGLIRLRSAGSGAKEEEAVSDAEKNAFNAILFVGVPGSSQERPMIPDEATAKSSNAVFFQDFFERQGYRKFITSISKGGFKKDTDGKQMTMVDVRINVSALRASLENNRIIKKFGI